MYVHVCKMETLREAYALAQNNDGAPGSDGVTFAAIEAHPGFWNQVQQGYANRICTSLPSSLRIAWKGVLKPRHFLGVRLAVMTMS